MPKLKSPPKPLVVQPKKAIGQEIKEKAMLEPVAQKQKLEVPQKIQK